MLLLKHFLIFYLLQNLAILTIGITKDWKSVLNTIKQKKYYGVFKTVIMFSFMGTPVVLKHFIDEVL